MASNVVCAVALVFGILAALLLPQFLHLLGDERVSRFLLDDKRGSGPKLIERISDFCSIGLKLIVNAQYKKLNVNVFQRLQQFQPHLWKLMDRHYTHC